MMATPTQLRACPSVESTANTNSFDGRSREASDNLDSAAFSFAPASVEDKRAILHPIRHLNFRTRAGLSLQLYV